MIDTEKYKKILDEGLLLDHYNLLRCVYDKEKIVKNSRIMGFMNLLCKKGYIQDGELTDKAKFLLKDAIKITPIIKKGQIVDLKSTVYNTWIIDLHKKCEEELSKLVGKKQVRDSINGKFYSFLPNSADLGRIISRVMTAYKLSDLDKIEKTIISYINKCATSKSWFPILQYYIFKNNMSTMVTDMENIDDDLKSDDTIVNI